MKNVTVVALALALALLSACGSLKAPDVAPLKIEDSEFSATLNRFNAEAAARGVDISHKLEALTILLDEESATDDACIVISVNRDQWLAADDLHREMALFHQLGHCVLDLDHDNGSQNLMRAEGLTYTSYRMNRSKMLSDMFGGAQ